MHKLLTRQLKRYRGTEEVPEEWRAFIDVVDEAYHQLDKDYLLIENRLDVTVSELVLKNTALENAMTALAFNFYLYEQQAELERTNKKLSEQAEFQQQQTKLLEKLLLEYKRAKDEAEVTNKLKSEFLARVSHELRTPLNAIIGYAEIMYEDTQGPEIPPPSTAEDLKKIIDSARHLLELINSLLDLSKIEAGKMDVFLEDIKVETFLNQLKNMIIPLMINNHNTFKLSVPYNLGSMHTDLVMLRQSLLNLLSNAAKFTLNGYVTLEVVPFKRNNHDWICFSIRDTGIGISQEHLKKLFQPFVQADGSTTRKYGGTGLGLYLTKRFSEMLGGSLEVESTEGHGTTFKMVLPLKSEMRKSEEITVSISRS